MKKFLLIFSYFNIVLYIIIYSYFDYMLTNLPSFVISAGLISFLKIIFLIAAGFSIGLIVSLFRGWDGMKSAFDYRIFILTAFIPFLMLVFSGAGISNFIITAFFNSNKKLTELFFYLFSRDFIYALWLGVACGANIKIRFKRNRQLRISSNWEVKHQKH